MVRSKRRPTSANSPRQTPVPIRITSADVDRAADSLLRDGQRPTIEKVRARIGRGSPNTINPLLDTWWSRLAGRLDAGPAALHRLPEPVLLAAEGLWMQALEESRRRAALEQGSTRKALARERQDLEVRSHVLSIREAELSNQLRDRDTRISQLEIEVAALTTLLRKEQASRVAAERRASTPIRTRAPRRSSGSGRATKPTAASPKQRPAKSRKPAKKTTRTKTRTGRKVPGTRRGSRR